MANQYHHKNLKNELLKKAIEMISEHGINSLSLRSLAKKCGVSHNAIYRHFDHKETLISCCQEYVTQELTDYLLDIVSKLDFSQLSSMNTLGSAYIEFYEKHPAYFSALYRNSAYKIIICMDETGKNYPPFEVFRKLFATLTLHHQIPQAEANIQLTRYWATLHGIVAFIVSNNVEMRADWKTLIQNIF